MATLRELFVKIRTTFDGRALRRGNMQIDRTKRKSIDAVGALGKLQTAFKLLAGAAVVHRIGSVVGETIRLGDETAKTADKLGIGTDSLQEMEFAAGRTGVPLNALRMGMQRFIRRSAEAAQGTGEAKDTLKALGIQLTETAGGPMRDSLDILGDVADAIMNTESEQERLRIAFKLFDSEGVALVNTLKNGKVGLDELRQAARDSGGVLTEEFLRSAEETTDRLQDFEYATRGLKATFVGILLPAINVVAKVTKKVSAGFQDMWKQSNALQVALTGLTLFGLRSLFFRFTRLGKVIAKIGLKRLLTRLGGIRAIIRRMLPLIGRLLLAFLKFALPILIFDELITTLQGGDTMIKRLVDSIFGLGTTEKVVKGLKTAFTEVVNGVRILWDLIFAGSPEASEKLETEFLKATENIGIFFDNLFADLGKFFTEDLPEFTAIMGEQVAAALDAWWATIKAKFSAGVDSVFSFLGFGGDSGGSAPSPSDRRQSPKDPAGGAGGSGRSVTINDQSSTTVTVAAPGAAPGAVERAVSNQKRTNRAAVFAAVGGGNG